MPLLPGKKNIGHNVTVEENAGRPKAQALAIALATAYDKKRKKKKSKE
jgi:hypothetical protein